MSGNYSLDADKAVAVERNMTATWLESFATVMQQTAKDLGWGPSEFERYGFSERIGLLRKLSDDIRNGEHVKP